jgi:integrase/recombinase XerD
MKNIWITLMRHSHVKLVLLEMGLDIMTLKDLLGHSDINSTLVYLHIAQLGRGRAFNPMDKLYLGKDK